jgi:hypothetical protein
MPLSSARDKLLSDLTQGEELLWSQAPNPVTRLTGKRGLIGIFAPLVFATIFIYSGFGSRWFFVLFACLAVGSVIYELIAAFWTLYAITSRRLIIVHPSAGSTIESYYPEDIEFIKKRKNRIGNGSIIFAALTESGKRVHTVEIGFFGIRDVDHVESIIKGLRGFPHA